MSEKSKRGSAGVPAQPGAVVTLRIELTAEHDKPNQCAIRPRFFVDAAPVVAKLLLAAHERGEMSPAIEAFIDAISAALAPQEAPVSAGKAGRA